MFVDRIENAGMRSVTFPGLKGETWGTLFFASGARSLPLFGRHEARRMGDDGDHLLAEDVEGITREAGGFDVRLVHGAGDSGAGDEIGPEFGEDDAFANGSDAVDGAAEALHA